MSQHLESSIKLSCCVVPHQAFYVTLHLQTSIKKLSFVSPSTFLYVTLLFTLELLPLCQVLLLKQTGISGFHSSLVTTPLSRMIPGKLKIEGTKDPIHHVGKNGEQFIKSNQHMVIPHAFVNDVRATFNHGLSPSETDFGDPKGEPTKMFKHTSSGCMLMEIDWGGKLKLNYTSCG